MSPLRYLSLLPLVTKNADLIQEISALVPGAQALFDDVRTLLDKHKKTINSIEALTPRVQKLVNEALALLKEPPQPKLPDPVDPASISTNRNW